MNIENYKSDDSEPNQTALFASNQINEHISTEETIDTNFKYEEDDVNIDIYKMDVDEPELVVLFQPNQIHEHVSSEQTIDKNYIREKSSLVLHLVRLFY